MYAYEQPPRRHPCKTCVNIARPVVSLAGDFCAETSMHGFSHIAKSDRHWIERLLWIAATSLAIWGAVYVSLGQLQRYNESPTVVALEKDFRSWRFSLPAVTACMRNRTDPEKLKEVIKDTWDVDPSDEKYQYYARFVSVVTDSDMLNLEGYLEFQQDEELDVDLYQLVVDVMPDVDVKHTLPENMFVKWIPVMTEAGACYSINSLAIGDVALTKPTANDTAMYPLTCKYGGISCSILLRINNAPYTFYFHSPYDILDITQPQPASFVYTGLTRVMEVTVIETGCGRGVDLLTAQRRDCAFTHEPTMGRKVYSTNSCRLSCRSKIAIKKCGCRPFYYFYEGPPCSPAGMACLASISQEVASVKDVKCVCSSQCLYSVFRDVNIDDKIWSTGTFALQGSVKYVVLPPKIRYTREIVFHFQDLVVSFGGAAGLFLGASFISFVEIIYFALARILGAVAVRSNDKQLQITKNTKSTYEEQRVMELNKILENNLNYEKYSRGTYF